MILEILHEFLALRIVEMEQGVFAAGEFKRCNMVSLTEITIESRSGFNPVAVQKEFHKAVTNENIRAHEIDELLRGQMVADRCKTDTGRNATGPGKGTEERGLGDAEAPAPLKDSAGAVMLRPIKRRIGIIAYAVAHSQIELYGTVNRIDVSSDRLLRISADARVVAIDNIRGG